MQLWQLEAVHVLHPLPVMRLPSALLPTNDCGRSFSTSAHSQDLQRTSCSWPMLHRVVNSCWQPLHRNRYTGMLLPYCPEFSCLYIILMCAKVQLSQIVYESCLLRAIQPNRAEKTQKASIQNQLLSQEERRTYGKPSVGAGVLVVIRVSAPTFNRAKMNKSVLIVAARVHRWCSIIPSFTRPELTSHPANKPTTVILTPEFMVEEASGGIGIEEETRNAATPQPRLVIPMILVSMAPSILYRFTLSITGTEQ